LQFLGFPWSIRDLSKGYARKNKKFFRSLSSRGGL
jgi:hypothetical protein